MGAKQSSSGGRLGSSGGGVIGGCRRRGVEPAVKYCWRRERSSTSKSHAQMTQVRSRDSICSVSNSRMSRSSGSFFSPMHSFSSTSSEVRSRLIPVTLSPEDRTGYFDESLDCNKECARLWRALQLARVSAEEEGNTKSDVLNDAYAHFVTSFKEKLALDAESGREMEYPIDAVIAILGAIRSLLALDESMETSPSSQSRRSRKAVPAGAF